MKCDELQERWFEAYPVEGDQIIPTKVYGITLLLSVAVHLVQHTQNGPSSMKTRGFSKFGQAEGSSVFQMVLGTTNRGVK